MIVLTPGGGAGGGGGTGELARRVAAADETGALSTPFGDGFRLPCGRAGGDALLAEAGVGTATGAARDPVELQGGYPVDCTGGPAAFCLVGSVVDRAKIGCCPVLETGTELETVVDVC